MNRGPSLDEETIRAFLATDYPRLVAAMGLIAGSRAVGEDAVQEAVARAWERAGRGERIDSLPAWVTTVATNLLRSRFRRLRVERRNRHVDVPMQPAPEDLVDLRRALARLPRRQREVTVLRYYLDLDVAEIADALGVSQGTVKTSLHRARRGLAVALGDTEMEEANDRAGL